MEKFKPKSNSFITLKSNGSFYFNSVFMGKSGLLDYNSVDVFFDRKEKEIGPVL